MSGGVRDANDNNKNGYQVILGIKVPLYYATKQREAVRGSPGESRSRRAGVAGGRQARAPLPPSEDNMAQVQRAGTNSSPSSTMRLSHRPVSPSRQPRRGYAVGKVDFLTLLSSLLTLQDNELELHSEIVEHEKALARLEEIIGRAHEDTSPFRIPRSPRRQAFLCPLDASYSPSP